jgi:hypothetical protein
VILLHQRRGSMAVAIFLLAEALFAVSRLARADESSGPFGWKEISWPFPRDAWEPGRAFMCKSEECGGEITLYVRPKIGFCNCTAGISDDEEVDRVTDLDLLDPRFEAVGDGRAIQAAGMQGRVRHYSGHLRDGSVRTLTGIALSRKCDVVVAIAQSRSSDRRHEQIAFDLLSSPAIQSWIEAGLDGRR